MECKYFELFQELVYYTDSVINVIKLKENFFVLWSNDKNIKIWEEESNVKLNEYFWIIFLYEFLLWWIILVNLYKNFYDIFYNN